MTAYFQRAKRTLAYRILSAFIACAFSFSYIVPPGYAQSLPATVMNLPVPGTVVPLSAGFVPPRIIGMTIHADNPLMFDFMVDPGDSQLTEQALQDESLKLVKYFLASMTVPAENLWVNLSPYEKDRIVPAEFGQTEMGTELLAQDYLLKQLTASLMNPEDELGKKFWDRVYEKAQKMFGTTEIPMNTFNKIWILPEKAVVHSHGLNAFVIESRLKVMLEEDYLAMEHHTAEHPDAASKDVVSGISSSIIKEVLLPEIEKEVNEGKTFANLRQIYNSMILAAWYKENLKESLLGKIYADQGKTVGLTVKDKETSQKIYSQYVAAFEKGVYNFIREDIDPATNEMIPRKYFSGGISVDTRKIGDMTKQQAGNMPDVNTLKDFGRAAADSRNFTAGFSSPNTEGGISYNTPFVPQQKPGIAGSPVMNDFRKFAADEMANRNIKDTLVKNSLEALSESLSKAEIYSLNDLKYTLILFGETINHVTTLSRFSNSPDILKQAKESMLQFGPYMSNHYDSVSSLLSAMQWQRIKINQPELAQIGQIFLEIARAYQIKNTPTEKTSFVSSPVTVAEWIEKKLGGEEVELPASLINAEKKKRTYVIGGNLKMKLTPSATAQLVRAMAERIKKIVEEQKATWQAFENIDVVIAPSFTSLSAARQTIDAVIKEGIVPAGLFQLGAQNVSHEEPGAQTGEESVESLKELGVSYVILGHSERRHGPMQESSELINKKAKRVLRENLTPIIAVGETANEYKEKNTYRIIADQFTKSTADIDLQKIVVAYEPVWAIGTGLTPTPQGANGVQRFIRALAMEQGGNVAGEVLPIEYGGSMTPKNVDSFIAESSIDGGLIGGAALKADDFIEIVVKSLNHYLSAASPVVMELQKGNEIALIYEPGMTEIIYESSDLEKPSKPASLESRRISIKSSSYYHHVETRTSSLSGQKTEWVDLKEGKPHLFDESGRRIDNPRKAKDAVVQIVLGDYQIRIKNLGVKTITIRPASSPVLAQSMPVSIPEFFANSLKARGLKVKEIAVAPLKAQGGATAATVLDQPYVTQAVALSISQALGSILFAGQGTDAKVVADANAVWIGHESLIDTVGRDKNIAIVSIASEGIRDGSVGTPLGRVYWSGYEGNFRNSKGKADYEAQITMLRQRGVQILYLLDDALENTNALKAEEALSRPTDSWSVTAFHVDDGVSPFRHMLDETNTRRLSVMANSSGNAGLTALDSPRTVLQKLAAANGISQLDSPEGRAFAKKIIMAVLGDRKKADAKESSGQRHSFYIDGPDGIQALQNEYGVRSMIFGDGDLMPGLLAATGIKLDENGSIIVKFGRSGVVEGETMELGASQIDGAQFAGRTVSNGETKDRVDPQTALKVEDGLLGRLSEQFGYLPDSFQIERTNESGRLRGKAVVAMTAVTGADPNRYLGGFAEQLKRITFNDNEGTVILNTFLISPQGVFSVRTTLESQNLQDTKSSIMAASPEAKIYLAASGNAASSPIKGEAVNKDKLGGIDLNPGNMDLRTNYGGDKIQLPMPQMPLENIRIDGLVPIIIHVAPVTNLPLLLGLGDEKSTDTAEFAPQQSPADAPRRFKAREVEEIGLLN